MGTIANLAVSLTARTAGFEKGFKNARRTVNSFAGDLTRHVGTIARYGAAIVGVAAGATALLVRQQLEAVNTTSKLARTLGIATESLVGYEEAAELAGVSSSAVATAIFKLNKSTDASLAGMTTDQRILAVAEQYNAIGSAAGRATLLTKYFGRAGLEMGAFFEIGADGLRAAKAEAIATGQAFSASEGLGVERALKAFDDLKDVITGVARRIAIQLAPFIQVASNRLIAFAQNGNTMGSVVTNAVDWISGAIGNLADKFALVQAAAFYFKGAVLGAFGAILQASNLVAMAIGKIGEILGIERMEGFADAFDSFADSFTDAAVEAFEAGNKALGEFANGTNAKKVTAFFEGIQVEAAKAAEATALLLPNVGAGLEDGEATTKTAQFRQYDPRRVGIGGFNGSSDKPVSKAQGTSMISELRTIARNTSNQALVV